MKNLKILLAGANGQLGQELQLTKPAAIELIALTHQQLDITQTEQVKAVIAQHKPYVIVNASAYTAVDDAEKDRALAYAVNATGPENLAKAALRYGARLIHVSTDYVFDGTKNSSYLTTDVPNPLNYYGESKLQGEKKLQEILPDNSLIIRTSWVYSRHGKNFVKNMLQHLGQCEKISMVTDQIGAPTWAKNLASAIWQAINKKIIAGIYHWTDAAMISKYDFLIAIQEEALKLKLLTKMIPIVPIVTPDFPLPAKRPLYAVLDISTSERDFDMQAMPWRKALQQMLEEGCEDVRS